MTTLGERFAQALGRKDQDALCALLADTIDFQALTPRRHWQAATGQVVDCEHVAYRLRVRTDGRDHLVEQQAYYRTDGRRITWMRVLCSGYQPLPA